MTAMRVPGTNAQSTAGTSIRSRRMDTSRVRAVPRLDAQLDRRAGLAPDAADQLVGGGAVGPHAVDRDDGSPAWRPASSAGEPSMTEMMTGPPARASTVTPMPGDGAVEGVVLRGELVAR